MSQRICPRTLPVALRRLRCAGKPRRLAGALALLLSFAPLPAVASPMQLAGPESSAAGETRTLVLESIELNGATRTSLATVSAFLPLTPGQIVDQKALIESVAELQRSDLFSDVAFSTRPGSSRGRLVLVLDVREHGLDLRWAAGNTDLDGWYLSPVTLVAGNLTGRGDRLDLQLRWGFRHTGTLLGYTRPRIGQKSDYWAVRFGLVDTERPWFSEGVEYRQDVESAGLAGVYGRRWSPRWLGEVGLHLDAVRTSRTARAHTDATDGSVSYGDEIGGDALPRAIRDGLGEDFRAIVHADLQHDTRPPRLRAGSPGGGLWGRVKVHGVVQGPRSHLGLAADLRSYRDLPGGVLAMRLRGAAVTANAAFYDRLYLGGMYTVRGFPTHALSAPGGDTWLWSSSLEYRSRILGDGSTTRLAGVLFLDAGASGCYDGDAVRGIAAGAGYGVRLRVWWLDWIGVDVAFPLTERPLDQRFQVTASIGWSF